MNSPEAILLKPTPWFLLRAVVMVVMFGAFSVLFYIDGSTGYRKKNENFYLHKAFQTANSEFVKMKGSGSLTAEEWKNFAEKQSVALPEDRSVMPATTASPLPWPAILHDFERMKPEQWHILWREYTKGLGLDASPPEEPYTASQIRDQWVVFWICSVLALVALYFLFRTIRRTLSVDGEAITTQTGKRVPFSDLKTLDLRKWETKGLAFIDYDGAAGKGRIRIDGLTYGGFKKENDEPAERLMRQIRSRFTGEIIEYSLISSDEPSQQESDSPSS